MISRVLRQDLGGSRFRAAVPRTLRQSRAGHRSPAPLSHGRTSEKENVVVAACRLVIRSPLASRTEVRRVKVPVLGGAGPNRLGRWVRLSPTAPPSAANRSPFRRSRLREQPAPAENGFLCPQTDRDERGTRARTARDSSFESSDAKGAQGRRSRNPDGASRGQAEDGAVCGLAGPASVPRIRQGRLGTVSPLLRELR